jgi:hypothetical protein
MDQIIQVAGALLILAGFAGAQAGRMSPRSLVYLWLNLVGSITLTVVALLDEDWGFVMLEAVWAIVSAWGLVTLSRQPDAAAGVQAEDELRRAH